MPCDLGGTHHEERVSVLEIVASYTLSQAELKEILGSEPAQLRPFLQSMMIASRSLWCIVLPQEMRRHFAENVFCRQRPSPRIQGEYFDLLIKFRLLTGCLL
jgi:hypothetical protein